MEIHMRNALQMYLCHRLGMPLSRPYMERNQAATTTPGSFGKNNISEVKLMLFHPQAMLAVNYL